MDRIEQKRGSATEVEEIRGLDGASSPDSGKATPVSPHEDGYSAASPGLSKKQIVEHLNAIDTRHLDEGKGRRAFDKVLDQSEFKLSHDDAVTLYRYDKAIRSAKETDVKLQLQGVRNSMVTEQLMEQNYGLRRNGKGGWQDEGGRPQEVTDAMRDHVTGEAKELLSGIRQTGDNALKAAVDVDEADLYAGWDGDFTNEEARKAVWNKKR